jgi:hypothetical protein
MCDPRVTPELHHSERAKTRYSSMIFHGYSCRLSRATASVLIDSHGHSSEPCSRSRPAASGTMRLLSNGHLTAHDIKTCGAFRAHMIATVDRSRHPVRPWLGAIAFAISMSLGGCSDNVQDSASLKTASYQGKPDTAPWDGPRWHGEQENWKRAIDARAQNQNDYVRIP